MNSALKYLILLCTFFLLMSRNSMAQSDSTIAKNTIYVEGLGNGIFGSLNYDRLLLIKKLKFSYRLGFIYLPHNVISFYTIPIEFNFLRGKKNHSEFGIGFSYVNGLNEKSYNVPDGSNFSTIYEYSRAIYLNVKPIGYRFQRPSGGLFFRTGIAITSKIAELNINYRNIKSNSNQPAIWPTISISLGYTFRKRKC